MKIVLIFLSSVIAYNILVLSLYLTHFLERILPQLLDFRGDGSLEFPHLAKIMDKLNLLSYASIHEYHRLPQYTFKAASTWASMSWIRQFNKAASFHRAHLASPLSGQQLVTCLAMLDWNLSLLSAAAPAAVMQN